VGAARVREPVDGMTTAPPTPSLFRVVPPLTARHRPWRLVERNAIAYRRTWPIFLTGFLEPILFLLSIGIGVGKLVGGIEVGGQIVTYKEFVAPGLLASAAMNGALLDTTFNFFVKYKYSHTYDAILATPVGTGDVATGEVVWALMRGAMYSTAFLLTMLVFGLVSSWWGVLAIPGAVLIGFAFAGAGLAGTTFMRSWVDFDYVSVALIPLFLFSATFFPITQYPAGLQAIIRVTPLYQGVVLERSLVLGDLSWTLLLHVAYLVIMGAVGLRVAARRIGRLLQP
jgi:lipooligosaccharide transport system permease protein